MAIFGISVPSGNFVPAMTIGAVVGRLVGESVDNQTNYGGEDFDAGKLACSNPNPHPNPHPNPNQASSRCSARRRCSRA